MLKNTKKGSLQNIIFMEIKMIGGEKGCSYVSKLQNCNEIFGPKIWR